MRTHVAPPAAQTNDNSAFTRTSSQMQILRVRHCFTSASHKRNFMLNRAKGRKSTVFFLPKNRQLTNKSTTNCFGNACAPRSCPNCSLFTSASSTHRPLFLALTDSALPTRKRLRLQTPNSCDVSRSRTPLQATKTAMISRLCVNRAL